VSRSTEIDYQAAAWLAALECGTADTQAFEQWRSADPAHALAFIRVSQLDDALSALRDIGGEDAARAGLAIEAGRARTSRRALLLSGAAGAFLLGAGALGWSFAAAARDAETAVGERRRIVIASGISVDLNTDSYIRWRHEDGAYDIALLRGELLLERQPGSARCTISCRDARIEPQAGRVNARLEGDVVEVAVLQGDALVRRSADEGATRVRALQQTRLTGASLAPLTAVSNEELDALDAWPRGELQFDGERLSEAVREYNRYLARPIVIDDAAIGDLRLGGRFPSSDPADFLKALNTIYRVEVHVEPERVRLSRS
jgi:transmembrane sensor